MERFTYKGHEVTVIEGRDGKSIFITNEEGFQIYAHKFTGSAMERAQMVLGEEEVKAVAVAASAAPVKANVLSFRSNVEVKLAHCGCVYNVAKESYQSLCVEHETIEEYRYDIYLQSIAA